MAQPSRSLLVSEDPAGPVLVAVAWVEIYSPAPTPGRPAREVREHARLWSRGGIEREGVVEWLGDESSVEMPLPKPSLDVFVRSAVTSWRNSRGPTENLIVIAKGTCVYDHLDAAVLRELPEPTLEAYALATPPELKASAGPAREPRFFLSRTDAETQVLRDLVELGHSSTLFALTRLPFKESSGDDLRCPTCMRLTGPGPRHGVERCSACGILVSSTPFWADDGESVIVGYRELD